MRFSLSSDAMCSDNLFFEPLHVLLCNVMTFPPQGSPGGLIQVLLHEAQDGLHERLAWVRILRDEESA